MFLFAGCALLAGIDHAADADMISRLEAFDIRANSCYPTNDLMTGHDRVGRGKPAGPVIADCMQVRMADTAVEYFEDHIIRPWIATREAKWGEGIFCRLCCVTSYIHCHYPFIRVEIGCAEDRRSSLLFSCSIIMCDILFQSLETGSFFQCLGVPGILDGDLC